MSAIRALPRAGTVVVRACAPALLRVKGIARRLETRLWTGPPGHLAGGAMDFAGALARYLLARALRRAIR